MSYKSFKLYLSIVPFWVEFFLEWLEVFEFIRTFEFWFYCWGWNWLLFCYYYLWEEDIVLLCLVDYDDDLVYEYPGWPAVEGLGDMCY